MKVKTRTFYIYTFGCQMNKSDSERISTYYRQQGWREVNQVGLADEIIINTCAVRQTAEDRVIGLVHQLASLPNRPRLVLTGCMLYHSPRYLKQKMPEVDEFLDKRLIEFKYPPTRKEKTTAWIPISNGCNSFCTYCVVPLARGREESRPMDDILAEVEKAIRDGYRHITLLGQNVNSYGLEKIKINQRKGVTLGSKMPAYKDRYHTLKGKPPFVVLLEKLVKYKELDKISFLTSNPWDFYDELIEVIANNPVIDRALHIPVQSGSNRILSLMNRWYTAEEYLELVKKIRQRIPEAKIGTDIIVGFPTETEADFQATLQLAKEVKWSVAYIAPYSPRPQTVAAKLLPDNVPYLVKKRRFHLLDSLINENKSEKNGKSN